MTLRSIGQRPLAALKTQSTVMPRGRLPIRDLVWRSPVKQRQFMDKLWKDLGFKDWKDWYQVFSILLWSYDRLIRRFRWIGTRLGGMEEAH